jgi:hypothetical protein
MKHAALIVEASVLHSLVTANIVPSSLILSILMMKVIRFSEMSGLIRATRRHIPTDGILRSHSCEKFKPYVLKNCFT